MKYPHFEHLWEGAEKVIEEYYTINEKDPFVEATEAIKALSHAQTAEEKEEGMGRALINLCAISKTYDVNTYKVLLEAVEAHKIEMLEPDLESEM